MPNHVDQDLVITGEPSVLREFMSFAEEGEHLLSANKFIPYPEKYRILDEQAEIEYKKGNSFVKDGYNSGGYEWCRDNWGTKWGIYDAVIKSQKLTGKIVRVKYKCQSAWSPAVKIVLAMSKKFPTLTFDMKYYERGMQFKGNYVAKNGELLKDETGKYSGRRGG
jgi:hypothetical protein